MTMEIKLVKFGESLISRPAGREAYLSAKAYLFKKIPSLLEIDFTGVKVLTPSWLSEFVAPFRVDFPETTIKFLPSDNPSVQATLQTLDFLGRERENRPNEKWELSRECL